MIILFGKITLAVGLIDFAQEGTGKRPRTPEIRQVLIVFRERLHMWTWLLKYCPEGEGNAGFTRTSIVEMILER